MQEELLFIGYRSFTSKANNQCNVLEFLSKPKKLTNGAQCSNISIFVDEQKYKEFINKTQLMTSVKATYEIVGNRVRYSV